MGPATLVVVTRAPEPGRVKTRLTSLTPEGQARIAAAMVEDVVAALLASALGRVVVAADPGPDHPWFQHLAEAFGVDRVPQPPGDLGQRLHGLSLALGAMGPVLFVGGDCPHLPLPTLRALLDALPAADAALAPAEDGGYVAIALARPCPALFDGIPWSTGAVTEATVAAARAAGIRLRLVEGSWDVDRPEDLERLRALEPPSAASRTRNLLENPALYRPGATAVR